MGHLRLPVEPVQNVLSLLERSNLIVETHDEPPAYLPARDIETITLKELLNSVRMAEKGAYLMEHGMHSVQEVEKVLKRFDDALDDTLGDETIKNLVLSGAEVT